MRGLRYASVCSGIEAASVAWKPLGWAPSFFAEIEPFPCAVLKHHYPDVPNHGDITKFKDWPDAAFDVLVGGTPCQSFSVAGLRKGLADPRGNLALVYLAIADRYRPEWLVWENVPGVLSSVSHDAPDPCPPPPPLDLECDGAEVGTDDDYRAEELHAFNCFVAGLSELGYGWAYRVLDAQYVRAHGFGRAVPQRRRRVFVVGHLGDWRRAAAVLFERESLCGNPAPRREAGQGVAGTIKEGSGSRGWANGAEIVDRLVAFDGQNIGDCTDVSATLDSGAEHTNRGMHVAHSLRADGFDASEDGTGRGTPLLPIPLKELMSKGDAGALRNSICGYPGDPMFTLQAAMQHGVAHPIAFSCKDHGADAGSDTAPTLRAMGHDGSHANAGGQVAVAFDQRGREGGSQFEGPHDSANIRAASGGSSRSYVAQQWAVRRLTPLECERLQGFPDRYTDVPYRRKPAADGPRYKALGNSMAVNCIRWLGHRIGMVSALSLSQTREVG